MLKRTPKFRPNELRVVWVNTNEYRGSAFHRLTRKPGDIVYINGEGTPGRDAALLYYHLGSSPNTEGRSLLQELDHRGYDLTTLELRIRKKQP